MLKSTSKHTKYWQQRKIDWQQSYQSTWDHPHRSLIVWMLKNVPFVSLWEVGVGGGANLVKLAKELKGKQLGGSDVSSDAIDLCRKTFNGGLFHVEKGNDMMMSDKSVDVILSDMTLIYVDPLQIESYLKEFKRVSRNLIVLCEFHSPSWWERFKARLGGYHVYDYRKRLEKLGYYDIMVQHIPEQYWPGTDNNTQFRHIITAKI
jgi:ubiquinone/menaquinone biosynthesis C-methylase UbiE